MSGDQGVSSGGASTMLQSSMAHKPASQEIAGQDAVFGKEVGGGGVIKSLLEEKSPLNMISAMKTASVVAVPNNLPGVVKHLEATKGYLGL